MDIYEQIAFKIIQGQETIIGPVAIEQARLVGNLELDWDKHQARIIGNNGANVVDSLVQTYKDLFGKVSVQVCKEAAARYLLDLPVASKPKSLV